MKNAFDNQISKNNTYDVIVIGAGYIGCAVAYYLSNSGLKTALFDQGSYAQSFHRTIPAGALPLIANCWLNYFYKLRNLQILRSWSAPVADMPDGLPLLGPVPHMKGVYLATAFRSTVVVTPLVGKLITQLITTGKSDLDILQFTPERKFYVPN